MNIDIQQIVKTITRKNKGLQDPQLIYPARDWGVGMIGTLVIICAAVVFSIWQYHSYTNLSLDEEVVLAMISYRAVQVEEALTRYRALSVTHAEIISINGSPALAEEEDSEEGYGENDSAEEEDVFIDNEVETETTVGVPSLSI
ncbi:MAG: hypothetical protein ACK42D_01480 [Candidatus Paceibacteria bacterium]